MGNKKTYDDTKPQSVGVEMSGEIDNILTKSYCFLNGCKPDDINPNSLVADEIRDVKKAITNLITSERSKADREARIDELSNFAEDEGSSGAYYMKVNGNNINDRIAELQANQLSSGEGL